MKLKDQLPISHRQRTLGVFLSVLGGEMAAFLFSQATTLGLGGCALILFFVLFPKKKMFPILLLIFFILGFTRSSYALSKTKEYEGLAHSLVEKSNSFQGTVVEASSQETRGSRFIFHVDSTPLKVLVHMDTPSRFLPGDRLLLTGIVSTPTNQEDSTFDYVLFLEKDGIFLEIRSAKILKHFPPTFHILTHLSKWNRYIQERIKELWEGDQGALIAGILIGSRESMSQELKSDFQHTGLSHIVAISGSNITIIIVFIFSLLRIFTKRTQILTACLMILCFTFFVGASSAVVRASIMGILGLIAMLAERRTIAWYSLLISALIMSLINPYVLLYDVGFQLSFLAVLGLLFAGPLMEPFTRHLPTVFQIRDSLHMTLCAILFTTPIMLYYFNSFSFIAPLANLVITPWIPLLMLLSFLTLILSFIPFLFPFTLCFQLATKRLLQGIISLTSLLAHLPFASVTTPPVSSGWVCALSYLFLTLLLLVLEKRRQQKEENTLSLSIESHEIPLQPRK